MAASQVGAAYEARTTSTTELAQPPRPDAQWESRPVRPAVGSTAQSAEVRYPRTWTNMGANTSRNGTISVPSPSPPSTQLFPVAAPPLPLPLPLAVGESEEVFFLRRAEVEGDLEGDDLRRRVEGEGERREGERDGEAREPPPPRLLRVRGDMACGLSQVAATTSGNVQDYSLTSDPKSILATHAEMRAIGHTLLRANG